MSTSSGQKFWDRFADRYAARPIKDVAAYEALLADAASRLEPRDRVLEIGCGTGGTAIRLAAGVAEYIASDFSAEMIRIARSKPAPDTLRFVVAEAERAFEGGPFDAICAFNVLHLTNDMPKVLDGIFKNLRPGGLLISKTWCFAGMSAKLRLLFKALRLVRMFPPSTALSVDELHAAITQVGFEITDERIFGAYNQNPYIVARKPG